MPVTEPERSIQYTLMIATFSGTNPAWRPPPPMQIRLGLVNSGTGGVHNHQLSVCGLTNSEPPGLVSPQLERTRTAHPKCHLGSSLTFDPSHPGGNPVANLRSISLRCYPILVAFAWELTKETIDLPLGCLQGGEARGEKPEATQVSAAVHLYGS